MNTWKYFYEKCHGNQRGTIPPKNKRGRKQRLEAHILLKRTTWILHNKKSANIPEKKSKTLKPSDSSDHVLVVLVKAHLPSPDSGADSSSDTAAPESNTVGISPLLWAESPDPQRFTNSHGLELATAGHPWGQHQKFLEFVHVNGWLMDKFVPGATHVFSNAGKAGTRSWPKCTW